MEECDYCNGNGHRSRGAGQSLPTQKRVDFCSEENNSCDKNADCILTEGGRAFVCRVKLNFLHLIFSARCFLHRV